MGEIGTAVTRAAQGLFDKALEHAPAVAAAIALLAIGWVMGRVLRALATRGMKLVEGLVERATGRPARAGASRSAAMFGALVFWVVLLFFITAATQVLGLGTFTAWLSRLLDYLPTLAAGLLIIAAGFVLARFVGDLVHAAAEALAAPQRAMLARLAQGATLLVALLVGADQIGLRVTWIAILVVVIVAAVLGGVILTVSLGARGYVSSLIGAHYLRQALRVGEFVRVAGHSGRVLEVSATSLVLETEEGRVILPGRVFHDEPIVLIDRAPDG
jgi:hypothetical protein